MLRPAAYIALAIALLLGVGGCKSMFWPPPHEFQVLAFVICLVFLTFGSALLILENVGRPRGGRYKQQFKLLLELAKALGIKLPDAKAE